MRRWFILIAFVAIAAGSTAVWAVAARNDAGPATITGCLSKSGELESFAVGSAPSETCKRKATQVALSGGDITRIATPPEGGLVGGTDSGSATLSLQQRFQLPQTCSSGDTIRYSSTLQYWTCGSALESTAYEVFRSTVPFTVTAIGPPGQKVMTLNVPPGVYTVESSVAVHKDSGSGLLVCLAQTKPTNQISTVLIQALGTDAGGTQFSTNSATGTTTVPTGGTIELWCRQGVGPTGPNPIISFAGITAVSVAKAVVTEDTSSGSEYGG